MVQMVFLELQALMVFLHISTLLMLIMLLVEVLVKTQPENFILEPTLTAL
jgi:hypothetical protein